MTRQAVPLPNRLASAVKGAVKAIGLHAQQITTLQSQVAALSALKPGAWENITLQNGWSNVAGYVPAQVRILQSGTTQIIGHIQGGGTSDGTVVGVLGKGFYNTVNAHSFTINVLSGAAAVSVQGTISGQTDTNGLSNANTVGTSDSASGSGSHSHGPGSYTVSNPGHVHTNAGGNFQPATPVNYNTAIMTLDASGNLTLANCSSSATQLSFSELLPLFTG
jgi:hypothetical protein